jgi:NAD(P)-dependent dehydrogenase (short-subunit alcohol dehydrogenase family)
MNLSGNTIFVTGGDSGSGCGFAETLQGKGNKFIISGRRKSAGEGRIPGLSSLNSTPTIPRAGTSEPTRAPCRRGSSSTNDQNLVDRCTRGSDGAGCLPPQ